MDTLHYHNQSDLPLMFPPLLCTLFLAVEGLPDALKGQKYTAMLNKAQLRHVKFNAISLFSQAHCMFPQGGSVYTPFSSLPSFSA